MRGGHAERASPPTRHDPISHAVSNHDCILRTGAGPVRSRKNAPAFPFHRGAPPSGFALFVAPARPWPAARWPPSPYASMICLFKNAPAFPFHRAAPNPGVRRMRDGIRFAPPAPAAFLESALLPDCVASAPASPLSPLAIGASHWPQQGGRLHDAHSPRHLPCANAVTARRQSICENDRKTERPSRGERLPRAGARPRTPPSSRFAAPPAHVTSVQPWRFLVSALFPKTPPAAGRTLSAARWRVKKRPSACGWALWPVV